MQHHRHAGLAGRLAPDRATLQAHPDAVHPDARMAWFPVAARGEAGIDALEGLLCVPTRPGAMRIAAVPHVVEELALGDEVAVGDWEGEPLARGELALALAGTVRCVAAGERDWRWLAQLVDVACGGVTVAGGLVADGPEGGGARPWHDVIGDQALASSVPREALGAVFETLATRAEVGELRWEYVTAGRHD